MTAIAEDAMFRIRNAAIIGERERCLNIARGCFDYGGGYGGEKYEAFQHGIQTVVRALSDMTDSYQLRLLEHMGKELFNDDGSRKKIE